MNTDKSGLHLPRGDITYAIVGSAMEVLNEMGPGLHEKPYERALVVEFGLRGLGVDQQSSHPVLYKGVQVGEFTPDLIVAAQVVVDTKVIERITEHERGQILNYLRITRLKVGLIINFHRAKLEWERIVL